MKKLFTLPLAITALLLMSTVQANTLVYTPPAEIGNVYVVVNYNKSPIGTPIKTSVNINWGGWSKTGSFSTTDSRGCGAIMSTFGFVIKLYHSKKDSYAISATSDGKVVSVSQGNAPSQWSSPCYQQISW